MAAYKTIELTEDEYYYLVNILTKEEISLRQISALYLDKNGSIPVYQTQLEAYTYSIQEKLGSR